MFNERKQRQLIKLLGEFLESWVLKGIEENQEKTFVTVFGVLANLKADRYEWLIYPKTIDEYIRDHYPHACGDYL